MHEVFHGSFKTSWNLLERQSCFRNHILYDDTRLSLKNARRLAVRVTMLPLTAASKRIRKAGIMLFLAPINFKLLLVYVPFGVGRTNATPPGFHLYSIVSKP